MMPIGFIAGTGFEHLLKAGDRRRMTTVFGRFDYFSTRIGAETVHVIPRHGFAHEFAPFRMPSKAHLFGFRLLGLRRVLAASSVASANDEMLPGDVVLPDQFIDLTKKRDSTYYHFDETVHTDMTEPFCESMRRRLRDTLTAMEVKIHTRGVYAATEGPRYQTPAEISMIRKLGGDIVGQSAVQEAVLARELGMCYTLVAVVSSRAAGLQARKQSRDIIESIWSRAGALGSIFECAIPAVAKCARRGRCTENGFEADRLFKKLKANHDRVMRDSGLSQ